MSRRLVVSAFALLVALSLVGAPVTMADWSEQVSFSASEIDASQVRDETPVLRYDELDADAQDAVRQAVESPDGSHVVYGDEDWPDRFFYSDYTAPGQGLYAVVYEGDYYRLYTFAAGGFPVIYWLYELPFVAYGLALGRVGTRAYREEGSVRLATGAAVVGAAFHLVGPVFDFPVGSPTTFVGLGVVAAAALVGGVVATAVRNRSKKA
ncbi:MULTISPECIES: hypothetical protein [Haloferax]|uniref:DUF7979 domain-containing protein n=1 Tax=Haloferax massiliensis TaxID=1476858 RepID=A0A0D6JL13_9EURY|nr:MULTISPECIES: hypothetical protein [Haloferax]MDS0242819.1 hypothetical protein [Haloferax sp. S2CR25]MDS0445940.1 hypothetical protein [Haloferax sp. S2CR25-2]CQR48592.1 hypothetical protein BN996_00038 [Haloferax massiliensis]